MITRLDQAGTRAARPGSMALCRVHMCLAPRNLRTGDAGLFWLTLSLCRADFSSESDTRLASLCCALFFGTTDTTLQ